MAAAGVRLMAGLDELAVMGVAEVIPRLAFFRGLEKRVAHLLQERSIDVVVPIDFPGFNMRVARLAKRAGRRVLYYVAPKAWAWREGRARQLAEITDVTAVILPFEKAFFEARGVRVELVGHPLLDAPTAGRDERAFRERWRLPPDAPLLALMPGSRPQEISRHLALFQEAAERVRARRGDVLPVVARPPSLPTEAFARTPFPIVDGARELLRHASAALVKSGTGTLEAALEDTPMVVAYRTSTPTWWAAKMLVRTEHVSLPNLIAKAPVVPEHLQGDATAPALAEALLPLLDPDSRERAEQLSALERVRGALGAPGAAGRVADLALGLLGATA
jgi:lipid-A-disaccharide synthase